MPEKTENAVKNPAPKYSKEQILNSKKWRDHKDLANALFDENKLYSAEEIQKTFDGYLKGKVI